jgi:chromosome segregation ATPase
MSQANRIPGGPSPQGLEMIGEKLKELEGRVKAAVALIVKVRGEKSLLEQRVEELKATISGRSEQMKSLEAGRKKDQEQLSRLQRERDDVRLKIDRLLEEIAKIEASVEPES